MALEPAFMCELDPEASTENIDGLRVSLATDRDAYEWLASYGEATSTSWIVDWETPDPKRYGI